MIFNPDQRFWWPRNLDIGVTDLCSQNCSYCYLRLAPGAPRGDMLREVCDQIVAYTWKLAKHHAPEPINWNFFGGEPMEAFEVIGHLVTEAEHIHLPVHIEVFTNGAAGRDDQIRWCREHGITPKRSVGGCPTMCQLTRPGDYLERYEQRTAAWDDKGMMRRVTLVPGTEPYIMDTLRYFYGRGYWGGIDFVTDDYAEWSEPQIATLKSQLTRLAHEFIRQFRLGHVLYNERLQVTAQWLFQEPQRLNIACGAGWGTVGITWDGYVVPCHRFLREPRDSPFCAGKLSDVLMRGPQFGAVFTDAVARASQFEENDTCRTCEARYCCQHGCWHLSWVKYGDLSTTPPIRCEITRHYVELARMVNAELAPIDPIWYLCQAEHCVPIPETA